MKINKIAIMSDSHDNIANIKKAFHIIKEEKIKTILHCGDICNPETLKEGLNINFFNKIYFTSGNAGDPYVLEKLAMSFKNMFFYKNFGEITINRKRISFCHFPDIAEKLALSEKYHIVFHGHTHKPWRKKIKETEIVNPGNMTGIPYKPTFAIYDTNNDNLELKLL